MAKILGIDFGDVRVGLALSDENKLIAFPYRTISYTNKKKLISKLIKIISEHKVDSIVIGLPLGLSGSDTKQTLVVREFAKTLNFVKIPVFLEDERFSSVIAKKSLIEQNIKTGQNKSEIDKRAASIILQQYIDKMKR
tara:strand:+ start:42143 stop:42556 length:414 start_codon:yes stop_codon:yes gene_type:complete